MKNLIFSLNATVPVFLLMALGFLFRKLGWIDEVFASKMNQFVFLVPLPLLVFEDLASVDFQKVWNLKFVLFCFFVTLASIALAGILSLLWKNRGIRGEFIQASYRSSAALLGIAFIQNIYGDAGLAPLMIIGSVPLYNMMAVAVLSFFMEKDAERDRDQSNHNRHSRRSFLVGASDTDAVCNRKNSVKYRRCRDASWIDGARRFF